MDRGTLTTVEKEYRAVLDQNEILHADDGRYTVIAAKEPRSKL